ncbi:MAG: DUF2239 domain-containing protein [Sphingobium sp.]|nr:MAG: DUF2239 domain-containing protein [Sphingobium sp.]
MEGSVTAFLGDERVAAGGREAVTRLLEDRYPGDHGVIRVFDDSTGRITDLDYWDALQSAPPVEGQRGRGRPSMGVKAREVTLLPRQWEWLAAQPGGASSTLRRLVEEARKEEPGRRARQDAAYAFMQATCGDRPGYEEALRDLYRDDATAFTARIADWPGDVRGYIVRLYRG